MDRAHSGILGAIAGAFGLGPEATVSPLGNGHINETVLVEDGDHRFVAQRINTLVFPDPARLVRNACLIERHLERKRTSLRVVRHLPGDDGRYLFGPLGDVRVLEYIPATSSIEVLEHPAQGERAACAFASFSRMLSDFDAGRLETVIPDFHSPAVRWHEFQAALDANRAGRVQECADEIAFAAQSEHRVGEWQRLMDELPVRVCHNDGKTKTLLVHRETAEPLAVIDLDTCMPGAVLADFGDLVRTCCSPEAEDSTRLEAVTARPEVYQALLRGYLAGWRGELSTNEGDALFSGGLMMSFIVGLRFLTDYLNGDRYFSVSRPRHNLERARSQFKLFSSLLGQVSELDKTPAQ